jgi:hypothetical protein
MKGGDMMQPLMSYEIKYSQADKKFLIVQAGAIVAEFDTEKECHEFMEDEWMKAVANPPPIEMFDDCYLEKKATEDEKVILDKLEEIESDGGSSEYYSFQMPVYIDNPKYDNGVEIKAWVEVEDLIRHMVDNDFDLGNIIKAARRIAQARKGAGKKGTDERYDWNKIHHTAGKQIIWMDCNDSERNS